MAPNTRTIAVDKIVGPAEAIARLEKPDGGRYSKDVWYKWRRRHVDFPKPLLEVAGVTLFDFDEIRTWVEGQQQR